jgi:hypothetical protein
MPNQEIIMNIFSILSILIIILIIVAIIIEVFLIDNTTSEAFMRMLRIMILFAIAIVLEDLQNNTVLIVGGVLFGYCISWIREQTTNQ